MNHPVSNIMMVSEMLLTPCYKDLESWKKFLRTLQAHLAPFQVLGSVIAFELL